MINNHTPQQIICKQIPFGSSLHEDAIALRREILRKPLNLDFTELELSNESDSWHLAALIDHNLAGTLVLKPFGNKLCKMRQVAVSSNMQGKGIGKKLVLFSEEFMAAKGIKKIELHARETAVPFYLSLNYSLIPSMFLEVGIPHFKMFKDL
jgi:predicted GNAT family N-acyltransferase